MRLSRKDVLFLSLRLTVTISLINYTGILRGLCILLVYRLLSNWTMRYLFGLEAVAPVDTLLVHDDEINVANVICKGFITC